MLAVRPAISQSVVRNAYRQLYKAGLAAVQYSIPARHDLRDSMRRAFRESPSTQFSLTRIENTIDFFRRAAAVKGIEHKIVKNLCLIHYWQYYKRRRYLDL